MADDGEDTTGERARLEGIAWGAGSSEAEAARARIALADLDRARRPRPSGARRPAVETRAGRHESTAATDRQEQPATQGSRPAERTHPAVQPEPTIQDDATTGTRPDPLLVAGDADQGEPGLQAGSGAEPADGGGDVPVTRWDRIRRVLTSPRARPWVAGGVAAAVVVAFGTGLVVGTARPDTPASPSVTPAAGTVTLEQLLDAPQTYADQLPGSFEAPVSLHTTRLVFTNRSLSGDDAATPWNVWAGVGSDRSTICLVATADRLQATTACYPREDALHGSVSLSASSLSGTLTVNLSGGGVRGTVTNEY